MSGADDPHVDRFRLAADRHHLPVFQHPQQTGLQRQRHVTDFIEKQRAAIGLLQLAAHAVLARTGETAAAITEQFALDQAFGDRRAVEGDEGFVGALAGVMHSLGKGFLARAGFAIDQQRHVAFEHPQRLAEIRLQRCVTEANARQWLSLGHNWGRGDRRRFTRFAAQQGKQMPPVAGAQRPTRAGIGAGTTEQFIQRTIEKRFHRFAEQTTANMPQQVQRTLVDRADPPFPVKRQQPFAEQADRFGLKMETQQPLIIEAAQEIAALDHLRRQIDQCHGVELALPRDVMARRGHVEHRQQFAVRVEHRARRAGQAGVAAAKVFVLMDGQRLAFDQAGANAVGAFAGLAPVGAEPEPGPFENLALGRRGDAVEDHPARIGQQHRMTGAGELLMQAAHFIAGDLQHLLQAFTTFEHAPVLKHGGRHGQGRIEVIVLKTAQPRTGNRRVGTGPVQVRLALSDGEHLLGMATQMVVVHFLLFSPKGRPFQTTNTDLWRGSLLPLECEALAKAYER